MKRECSSRREDIYMSGKKGEHEPEKEGVLATIWDYAKTFLIIFLIVFALNKLVYINAVIGFDLLLETGSGVTQQGVDLPDFCQRFGVGSL